VDKALLRDVSLVGYAAYPAATAALGSAATAGAMTTTDQAWLKLLSLTEGPMSADVAAAKLRLVKIGWRPNTK
jgi:hypothetical protein